MGIQKYAWWLPWRPGAKAVNYAIVTICSVSLKCQNCMLGQRAGFEQPRVPHFYTVSNGRVHMSKHEVHLPRIAGHMLSGTEGPGAQLGQ